MSEKPRHKRRFKNPEKCFQTKGFHFASVRWILTRIFKNSYKLGIDLPETHVVSKKEALSLKEKYHNVPSITWLGHASFLLKIGDVQILTDPILFGTPATPLLKSLKRLPSPLQAMELTGVNILLLSHEHADHVHHPSLASLLKKEDIQPIVSLGIGKKILKHKFKESIELDWFEIYKVGNTITITAVPAVHYSDFTNSTLWSGFIISFTDQEGKIKKIYFGGDTGYGPFITRDIAPYGPFDIALIGVGAFELPYQSRAPVVHTNPEQAVNIAKEIQAQKIIGMHWGTMRMADEVPHTLFPRMIQHANEIGYQGEINMLRIGETIAM